MAQAAFRAAAQHARCGEGDGPAAGWENTDFADAAWSQGKGGFGTRETPNTKVATEWKTPDIWLRREFQLASLPKGQVVLRLFHDDDTEVFLNGVKIVEVKNYVTGYTDFMIPQAGLIKSGRNIIAIHCHQNTGGQYIDARIVEETAN